MMSKTIHSELTVVFTNKIITTPVRGAGRPQGIYIVERMLDIACKELDLDPRDVRRMNFIPSEAFPYDHEIIDQAFTELVFDSGNYLPAYDKALEKSDMINSSRKNSPACAQKENMLALGLCLSLKRQAWGLMRVPG